jgi:hypothetical protein
MQSFSSPWRQTGSGKQLRQQKPSARQPLPRRPSVLRLRPGARRCTTRWAPCQAGLVCGALFGSTGIEARL